MEFPAQELRKYFKMGDHVKVIAGRFEGDTGLIVRVEENFVILFSDLTMHEVGGWKGWGRVHIPRGDPGRQASWIGPHPFHHPWQLKVLPRGSSNHLERPFDQHSLSMDRKKIIAWTGRGVIAWRVTGTSPTSGHLPSLFYKKFQVRLT